jgi:hypothetical protein
MGPIEDLFRFVAIRDPQPSTRPVVVRSPSFDPAAPSKMHEEIVSAGFYQERAAVAGAYLIRPDSLASNPEDRPGRPRFVGSLAQAGAPISQLSELLMAKGDRLACTEVTTLASAMLTKFVSFTGWINKAGPGVAGPGFVRFCGNITVGVDTAGTLALLPDVCTKVAPSELSRILPGIKAMGL